MTDNQEPSDFDDTPPLSRILCDQYLDGKITLEAVAKQLGMSMEDAQGCVDVVQVWRDAEADAQEFAAKGDGIPF